MKRIKLDYQPQSEKLATWRNGKKIKKLGTFDRFVSQMCLKEENRA